MNFTVSPLFTWRSAIACGHSDATSTERLVALCLSLHMSERGDSAFPGIPLQTKETALSDRAVQKALRSLEEKGWLDVTIGGGRFSSRYQAVIPLSYYSQAASDHRDLPPGKKCHCGHVTAAVDEPVEKPVESLVTTPADPRTTFTPAPNEVHRTPEPGSPEVVIESEKEDVLRRSGQLLEQMKKIGKPIDEPRSA